MDEERAYELVLRSLGSPALAASTRQSAGDMLNGGKLADAIWELAYDKGVLGCGEEQCRALAQLGKGDGGNKFSSVEDFVIDEYIRKLQQRAPRGLLHPCSLSREVALAVDNADPTSRLALAASLHLALAVSPTIMAPLHLAGAESGVPHWVLVRIERAQQPPFRCSTA